MNTTTPHTSPPEVTVALAVADGSANRPVARLVGGSAPVSEYELISLLHKRLRFLLILWAAYYSVMFALGLYYFPDTYSPRSAEFWYSAGLASLCLGLAGLLSTRVRLPLRTLRTVEFVFFAALMIRLLQRGYNQFWRLDTIERVLASLRQGDERTAQQLLASPLWTITTTSALFLIAYGVIVPNNWRRCAIVVAVFAALPVGIWIVACVDHDLPRAVWFPWSGLVAFVMMFQFAIIAVYGAYRIESSRQEAAEARRLGQYVLREKIGDGGMGEVYLADHVLLRRPCAIKLIHPERAGDPAMLQRFEREVRATATLTHPNAVQVFDYGHTPDGTFYYVMEYLPGPTLEELVKKDGPLPPRRAIHFLRQLCGALTEAHAVGLIHRDIKPGNVIVCERGKVPDVAKLLDFGLVQSTVMTGDEKLTQVGSVLGTPAFLAPEQAGGEAVDGRTDIYALGALAYFLLTGQPPFVEKSPVKLLAAHLHATPQPPSRLRPDIPPELEAVVLRCLAKKPGDRFADVQELDRALAAALPSEK